MKPTKKLSIKKETIRQLTGLEMRKMAGGYAVTHTCIGCSYTCIHTYDDACGNSEGTRCPTFLHGCPVGG